MMIGVSRTHFPVTVLGPGTRAGIWLQGCSIRCAGCVSMDTWNNPDAGQQVTVTDVADWLSGLIGIEGVTISGGEPFDQPASLLELVRGIRERFDSDCFDILVFSGYSSRVLRGKHSVVLEHIDAVVTGPYLQSKAVTGQLRGSSNQNVELCSDLGNLRYGQMFAHPASNAGAQSRTGDASQVRAGFQVAVSGGSLWMIGIPAAGDMDRLEAQLDRDGVQLEEVSWRC